MPGLPEIIADFMARRLAEISSKTENPAVTETRLAREASVAYINADLKDILKLPAKCSTIKNLSPVWLWIHKRSKTFYKRRKKELNQSRML